MPWASAFNGQASSSIVHNFNADRWKSRSGKSFKNLFVSPWKVSVTQQYKNIHIVINLLQHNQMATCTHLSVCHEVSETAAPLWWHLWDRPVPAEPRPLLPQPIGFCHTLGVSGQNCQLLAASMCCHKHQRIPNWSDHKTAWAMTIPGRILGPVNEANMNYWSQLGMLFEC